MYQKQRFAYYELRDFLTNPPEGCRIAVLTGIRRIGKTGGTWYGQYNYPFAAIVIMVALHKRHGNMDGDLIYYEYDIAGGGR